MNGNEAVGLLAGMKEGGMEKAQSFLEGEIS